MQARLIQGFDRARLAAMGYLPLTQLFNRPIRRPRPDTLYKAYSEYIYVIIDKCGIITVTTPNGQAAFTDAHKEKYQELIDADAVEFIDNAAEFL